MSKLNAKEKEIIITALSYYIKDISLNIEFENANATTIERLDFGEKVKRKILDSSEITLTGDEKKNSSQ